MNLKKTNISLSLKKKIAIVLFFIMFIYSGIDKILNFSKKVNGLSNKLSFLPKYINKIGMCLVILLEIIGSSLIILYIFFKKKLKLTNKIRKLIYILFLLFLIVVTILYHPPEKKKMIPFLSNLSHFAAILYLFNDFENIS